MFKKVLIPLDGSDLAEKVLPYVRQITKPADTELILMRNIELNAYAFASDSPIVAAGLYDALHDDAVIYLAREKAKLEELGYRVEMELARGDTANAIGHVASDLNADLIAMTTHGRTGISRAALGSVADRVVRSATQPVLLVQAAAGAPSTSTIHRILVPLDGSELSEQALPVARQLASELDSEILLLQAIQKLADLQLAELFDQIVAEHGVPNEWYEQAVDYLKQMQKKLKFANITSDIHVAIGEPGQCILHATTVESCDLVVMSTHGRSGVSRWVYGSVASRVLHEAERPLLLIRGHAREEATDAVPQFKPEALPAD